MPSVLHYTTAVLYLYAFTHVLHTFSPVLHTFSHVLHAFSHVLHTFSHVRLRGIVCYGFRLLRLLTCMPAPPLPPRASSLQVISLVGKANLTWPNVIENYLQVSVRAAQQGAGVRLRVQDVEFDACRTTCRSVCGARAQGSGLRVQGPGCRV